MKIGVFPAEEWVYTDSDSIKGRKKICLIAARKSYACAQVLLNGVTGNISWRWESEDISAPAVFHLLPVFVRKNTGPTQYGFAVPQGTPAPYATRQAPFWVFDAMEPIPGQSLPAANEEGTLAIYLRWSTAEIESGEYTGAFHIGEEVIPVSLKVSETAVPQRETLRVTNWFDLDAMANYHGVALWSEEHWDMIRQYAEKMRYVRQTDFHLLPSLAQYKKQDGKYCFDFLRMEKFIRLFFSLGFQYIEGGPLFFRECGEADEFLIEIDGKRYPAMSEEAYLIMQGYFSALYKLLEKNGWLNKTTQHIGDEPHGGCASEYRILSGIIRKFMPGVPLIEAVDIPKLDGAVDIWVPKNSAFELERETFEKKRRNGDQVWFYTCCCPGGKYLNRLQDQELIRTRYLHWGNRLYDLPGYLHWGFNYYKCTADPYKAGPGVVAGMDTDTMPAGDSHIVYPQRKQVLGSVRLEMMRAGIEDYELFGLLKEKSPEKAGRLLKRCVRSFTDYTTDLAVFEQTYAELLEELK